MKILDVIIIIISFFFLFWAVVDKVKKRKRIKIGCDYGCKRCYKSTVNKKILYKGRKKQS